MTVQVGNPSFLYEEMLDDYEDTNIDPDLNSLREGKVTGSQRTRPPLGNSPHPSHCSLILAHGGGGLFRATKAHVRAFSASFYQLNKTDNDIY